MGIPVLIYGKSGCGKSTSLRNFGEDEILLAKVVNKPNPFKKKFLYTCYSDDLEYIKSKLSAMPTKTAVVDDSGYLMTTMYMTFAGNNFDKYDAISKIMWSLFKHISTLPPDVIVYIIMHEDVDDSGNVKPLTLGRLLDNKVNLPGMCTIVLHALKIGKSYVFKTQSDGMDVAKSPFEMFELDTIPNDLKEVDTAIREYYGFKES